MSKQGNCCSIFNVIYLDIFKYQFLLKEEILMKKIGGYDRHFTKQEIQMVNKCVRECSASN